MGPWRRGGPLSSGGATGDGRERRGDCMRRPAMEEGRGAGAGMGGEESRARMSSRELRGTYWSYRWKLRRPEGSWHRGPPAARKGSRGGGAAGRQRGSEWWGKKGEER